jgi:hypothetical protein
MTAAPNPPRCDNCGGSAPAWALLVEGGEAVLLCRECRDACRVAGELRVKTHLDWPGAGLVEGGLRP